MICEELNTKAKYFYSSDEYTEDDITKFFDFKCSMQEAYRIVNDAVKNKCCLIFTEPKVGECGIAVEINGKSQLFVLGEAYRVKMNEGKLHIDYRFFTQLAINHRIDEKPWALYPIINLEKKSLFGLMLDSPEEWLKYYVDLKDLM